MADPILSPYHNVLDTTKVVAFMEVKPQSDLFIQIKLGKKCYQEVLDVIEKHMRHNRRGEFLVTTVDKHVYKFPEIIDIYDDENPDKKA